MCGNQRAILWGLLCRTFTFRGFWGSNSGLQSYRQESLSSNQSCWPSAPCNLGPCAHTGSMLLFHVSSPIASGHGGLVWLSPCDDTGPEACRSASDLPHALPHPSCSPSLSGPSCHCITPKTCLDRRFPPPPNEGCNLRLFPGAHTRAWQWASAPTEPP